MSFKASQSLFACLSHTTSKPFCHSRYSSQNSRDDTLHQPLNIFELRLVDGTFLKSRVLEVFMSRSKVAIGSTFWSATTRPCLWHFRSLAMRDENIHHPPPTNGEQKKNPKHSETEEAYLQSTWLRQLIYRSNNPMKLMKQALVFQH